MNTRMFKINGFIIITTWISDRKTFTTYYTNEGKLIKEYSEIPKETQYLIEAALEKLIKEENLIKYSY